MFASKIGFGLVTLFFFLLHQGTAHAQESTSSAEPSARQENQVHLEVESGVQYFDPAGISQGSLSYGNVQGAGLNLGVGADYNFNQFSVGARLGLARTFPSAGSDPYNHFGFGPEIGWLRHFERISLHLQFAYAFHYMKHHRSLGRDYGSGSLTTTGHGFRPSAALRWYLGSHLYVGARASIEAIFFHRNNRGTFLCRGDLDCDSAQSVGLAATANFLAGTSF
jgi:hypothetical protein